MPEAECLLPAKRHGERVGHAWRKRITSVKLLPRSVFTIPRPLDWEAFETDAGCWPRVNTK